MTNDKDNGSSPCAGDDRRAKNLQDHPTEHASWILQAPVERVAVPASP